MSMFKSVDSLSLKSTLATGASAGADITVTGIKTEDTIICALELNATHFLPTDQTRRCTINDTNDVHCSKTTAGDKLWILWHDASLKGAIDSPCLKWNVVNGAGVSTDMAISGIATEDTLLAVMTLADTAATWVDDLAQCSITSAGNIRSTTDNSSTTLLVIWHDASGEGLDGTCLRFTQAAGAAALRNIRVPGITTDDEILACLELELATSTGLPTDRTSEASISSNGNIQLSTTTTADDVLIVIWLDKCMDRPAYNGCPINFELVAGASDTADIAIPDIRVDDTILFCVESATSTALLADRAASDAITIPTEGNIQLDTTDTTGDSLLVMYLHEDAVPDVNPGFNDSVAGDDKEPGYIANADREFICGAVADGATAGTAIAIAAKSGTTIKTEDTIIFCWELNATHNVVTDRTKETIISADGYIKITSATDSDDIVILWHRAGGGAYNPAAIKFSLPTGAAANTDITITGITTADTLLFCMESKDGTADITDRTDTFSIMDTDDIQCTVATDSDLIFVLYYDQSAAD